ncbi:MAG: hypothetical protein ABFR75_02930 [Acidobacteriota bacterium]
MEEKGSIFEEYSKDNQGIKNKLKQPSFWTKIVLIFALLAFIILTINVFKGNWSGDELKNSIEIVWIDTNWVEDNSRLKDMVTRIVPSIKIKIKNVGKRPLHYVDFEGVFEFVSDGKQQTSGFSRTLQEPLNPGNESEKILIKGVNGFTASSMKAFYENTEKWLKIRVKLFVRSKGTQLQRIGEVYPVEQKIEGFRDDIEIKKSIDGLDSIIKMESKITGWEYKKLKEKIVVYPFIDFMIRNSGENPVKKLIFQGEFIFEKSGVRRHLGYPALKKELAPGKTSKKLTLRSEFGIKVSSLQALYDKKFDWESVTIRVFVKTLGDEYVLLEEIPVKKEVKGVKLISN